MKNPILFFISAICGGIFMFIAAFIFLVAALLFIIRFVVIIFLMILSPIAFAGWILPRTAIYSEKWFNALLDQAYWPVVFMALLSFSLKATEFVGSVGGDGGNSKDGLMSALTGGASSAVAIVFQYFIIIAFLIATIYIAKQAGAKGADFSTKVAGSLTTGLAGRIGRESIGRFGNRIATSSFLQDQDKKGGLKGFGARMALGAAGWTRKRSFDISATPGISTVSKEMGVSLEGFGGVKKGGFMVEIEEKEKKKKEIEKQKLEDAKIAGKRAYEKSAEKKEDDEKKAEARKKVNEKEEAFKKDPTSEIARSERDVAYKEFEKAQKDADKNLKKYQISAAGEFDPEIADVIRKELISAKDEFEAKIKGAEAQLKIARNIDEAKKILDELTVGEVAELGGDILTNIHTMANLTPRMLSVIASRNKLKEDQIKTISTWVKRRVDELNEDIQEGKILYTDPQVQNAFDVNSYINSKNARNYW